ncbi:DUF397 domain-containing protein [Actinoplanes aureus]|uniref:DUF397 domain-containing protein n=1 Tax=Actinoplanes aureus TaxID=2792083 RepID=A0A931CDI1_9ACTN|nr:DUF397 domain-containing protein [Actinoplanes aureus]MBG0567905.1 DUF397 domain-containing protein [Actinoplanes aureus]
MESSTRLAWQKSSYCGNSTCVEVAFTASFVALRDAKDVSKPALLYSHEEWVAFLAGVKTGEFDLPD